MVALSSHAQSHGLLLRHASRMAGRLNRNWYAVTVQTAADGHLTMDSEVQRRLGDTLTLANQLGAMVFTLRGADVSDALLKFAREYQVGHLVVGRPQRRSWAFWRRGVVVKLLDRANGLSVVVVDTPRIDTVASALPQASDELMGLLRLRAAPQEATPSLHSLIEASSILVWEERISKELALTQLAEALAPEPALREVAVAAVLEREGSGSTFLNEGIALLHARVPGLEKARVALGLPKAGVDGVQSPVDVILMILSPDREDHSHLELLGIAGTLVPAARSAPRSAPCARWRRSAGPSEGRRNLRILTKSPFCCPLASASFTAS